MRGVHPRDMTPGRGVVGRSNMGNETNGEKVDGLIGLRKKREISRSASPPSLNTPKLTKKVGDEFPG